MAGFFSKVGNAVSEAANKTAKAAGDMTQKGKYKLEINKYQGEIKDTQHSLGKEIVESRLAGKTNEELAAVIDEAVAKVQHLNSEIERVNKLAQEVGETVESSVQEVSPEAPAKDAFVPDLGDDDEVVKESKSNIIEE